jgi:hemolysin activation/secretion protein
MMVPNGGFMLKLSVCTAAILAVLTTSQNAFSQPVPSAGGLAGGQIQQIPPSPLLQKSIPEIRVQKHGAPASSAPSGIKVLVKSLHVTGETKFSEAELIAVAGFQPGSEMDLAGLRLMASRISDYYNARGYLVAQAYLPAQAINEGAVTVAVIEGQYGKITLNNQSKLSDNVANNVLEGLDSGDIVATAPLERRLLLLSDLPGVEVRSTLTPGSSVGTSDLIVDLSPGPSVTGSVEADNAGNYYTGTYRVGGSVNFNEVFGQGDVASLRALTSTTGGLVYGRASYQAQVDKLTVGVAYAALWYKLGKTFEPLDAHGTAGIASVYASYPVIRSYDNNLFVLADYDEKTFQDRTGVPFSVSDRESHVGIIGLNGNHHDTFGGGGWDSFSLSGAFGDLDIQTPAVRVADAATARSNGSFGKVMFQADRLQNVIGPLSLYADFRGQVATKNLDISEKMELGGAYGVRAYPEGEAYADEGYILTLEARLLLPPVLEDMPGQMQLIGFFDTGSATLNKNPWFIGPNSRTLSAAGVGLTWTDNNDFRFSAFWAHKLGNEVATSAPDASDRVWLQVAKFF